MSLLDRIFGKKVATPPDPTVNWPASVVRVLPLAPYEGQYGDLKFGAPIDAARSLGKPSRFRWIQNDYCELLYARAGFQIDFEGDRFAYIAFFTDRHVAEPDVEGGFDLAVVDLRLPGNKSIQFSRESTRDVIEKYFGNSTRTDTDDDETILTYEFSGLTMELEMNPTRATLMRLNLYPKTGIG